MALNQPPGYEPSFSHLSAEALAVLLDHRLTHAHARVLLLRLADPALPMSDLAKQAGVSRSTAYLAVDRWTELSVSEVSDDRTDRTLSEVSEVSDHRTLDASERRGPHADARYLAPPKEISPSPECVSAHPPQHMLDEPTTPTPPTSERKRRQALARDFLDARAAAGFAIDPRDLERDYRRVVTALAPFMTTHTREQILATAGTDLWSISDKQIRLALNKAVAATKVPKKRSQAASGDLAAYAAEAASEPWRNWTPE